MLLSNCGLIRDKIYARIGRVINTRPKTIHNVVVGFARAQLENLHDVAPDISSAKMSCDPPNMSLGAAGR
ncbi:MAG: hypothetical protein NVS9B4_07890 [Candidatus Acidiferrum sp.]